ncbi:MAG: DUF2135 domain-containing protein [Bacteroidetes bacterium]|nr:DUF2135 domain-containing protein [Bacteroidota bacterium]
MKTKHYSLIAATLLLLTFAIIQLVIVKSKSAGTFEEEPEIIELRKDISTLEEMPISTLPVMNVNGGNSEVYLQSLDVQVEVVGNIATTRYVMVFKNRTNKILEGELLVPMPDGVTVSHYALDINGKMREAVPVPKAKATQVFEEIEQRRVDPGLLERVEGNNFRTRIYPIPAGGTRTISIGYEEELTADKGYFYYRLPMAYKEPIEKFSVKATVLQPQSKPQLLGKMANELTFDEQGENYVATLARNNYEANKALIFALPAPRSVPQVLIQSVEGSNYFLASCGINAKNRKKNWSDNLAIIWDVSLSGAYRDHAKELAVLDAIIKEKKNLTINLYFLNNKLRKQDTFKITNGDWRTLRKAIETAVYDGGTNFNAISLKDISGDEILFFTDGLSTLSDAGFGTQSKTSVRPVHAVVSSAKADYSAMKWIAAQTNGKFINLNALFSEQIPDEVLFETLHFMGIEPNPNVREVYPSVATPAKGNFSVAGIADAGQTELVLLFGYGNTVEKKVVINLNTKEADQQANVQRIWAQKKINELDMCYEQNKKELVQLGQKFGIVTRNTSLIVLETLWDYVRYRIKPPVEMQAEYDRVYGRWWRDRMIADEWEEETDIPPIIEIRYGWIIDKDVLRTVEEVSAIDATFATRDAERAVTQEDADYSTPPPPIAKQAVQATTFAIEYDSKRKITSEETSRRDNAPNNKKLNSASDKSTVSQPEIKLIPIKQDNNYIKELTGNVNEDYTTYLRLRPEYINTPTFYFDMADWFFKHGDRERALVVLTSIADLDLENASLYRLLGYRFKEYKEYELEEYVCKKVVQWRPFEPQSYRDYALALADNGKNQEALDNFCIAWDKYEKQRWQLSSAIPEVIETEIKRLVALNPNLDTSRIPETMKKNTPYDVRVVINWNMNNTDIDLHVTDPNGEMCYYGHRWSKIGGVMSQGVWQGYGPEQFLLKNAIKGKYTVSVYYYGDRQVKSEGPSTVMAEIYTKYAGKDEQRQVVCLQLSKENKRVNGRVKVAEFSF